MERVNPAEVQRAQVERMVRHQAKAIRDRQKVMARNARVRSGGGRHAPGATKPPLDQRASERHRKAQAAKKARRRNR